MASRSYITEKEHQNNLPPIISTNLREKVEPEDVFNSEELTLLCLPENASRAKGNRLTISKLSTKTVSIYPIELTWYPDVLYFKLNQSAVTNKLNILNICRRSIYVHCCGRWSDEARLGAGWRCYPRTRFLLAPGLEAEVFVRAKPKNISPVSAARVGLQVAAAHKRDHVIAYYMVPIQVQFENCVTLAFEHHSSD